MSNIDKNTLEYWNNQEYAKNPVKIYDYRRDENYEKQDFRYIVKTLEQDYYEANCLISLAAVFLTNEYIDTDFADTRWHMRRLYAKDILMRQMMIDEMDAGRELPENMIIYDERMGKIPYSYTGDVDYEIHVPIKDLKVFHIETTHNFLWSMVDLGFCMVYEKGDDGEYKVWNTEYDLKKLIDLEAKRIREVGDKTVLPGYKRIEDYM